MSTVCLFHFFFKFHLLLLLLLSLLLLFCENCFDEIRNVLQTNNL